MTNTVVLFTNNAHKVMEITTMLAASWLKVVPYGMIYPPMDVVEDGTTFEDNAIIKVNALPLQFHTPHGPTPDMRHTRDPLPTDAYVYLAEDSGIEVAALNGRPGIYSARYAGPHATSEDMCRQLLRECYGVGNREAQYTAVMALRQPNQPVQIFRGVVKGHLAHDMMGDEGFGYDPIFIPDDHDITFAQMSPSDKHALSHRYKALCQVRNALTASQNNHT